MALRAVDNAQGDGMTLPAVTNKLQVLTYGTTVAVNADKGNYCVLTIADAVGFTISNPSNVPAGTVLVFTLKNAHTSAHGTIAWGTAYKMAVLAAIATATNRTIAFISDGTNLIEMFKTPADVPN